MVSVIIFPGFHEPNLTQFFLQSNASILGDNITNQWLVFPTQNYPAYSSLDMVKFLWQNQGNPKDSSPLLLIAFSAGVVGAIGTANIWQLQGGKIQALIAFDGWGVPLIANFPIHRASHDHFTHWTSALLGKGKDSFFAEPNVSHLDLWQSPHQVKGWWEKGLECKYYTTATAWLKMLLAKYEES
jgi:hypothetical protein